MPNGIGKSVRVAVFTGGKNQEIARQAGADVVGLEDLAEKVKAGEMNFDVVIASPDAMLIVGQLGQILGPNSNSRRTRYLRRSASGLRVGKPTECSGFDCLSP